MWSWLVKIFRTITGLFNPGHNLDELARRLGLPKEQILDTPLHYETFSIKKKSGKPRLIAAPNKELKSLQRRMLRRLFKKLQTHPQATGFQPNISFVDNARCHQSQKVVIRLDLVDFFHSIPRQTLQQYFRRIGWNRHVAKILADLTTFNGALPQGAPTSPILSNLVNFLFDLRLAQASEEFGAIYTRYADDITISLSDDMDVAELVGRILTLIRRAGYRPHIKSKFDIRRSHQRQVVTGLVVNESANLSREKRRWLRAVKHRTKLAKAGGYLGPNPTLTEEQLDGWISLQKMIEDSK